MGSWGVRNGSLGVLDGRLGIQDGRLGVRDGRLGVQDGRLGIQDGRLGVQDGRLGVCTHVNESEHIHPFTACVLRPCTGKQLRATHIQMCQQNSLLLCTVSRRVPQN